MSILPRGEPLGPIGLLLGVARLERSRLETVGRGYGEPAHAPRLFCAATWARERYLTRAAKRCGTTVALLVCGGLLHDFCAGLS